MGRGAGVGEQTSAHWVEQHTPGGHIFWTRRDDPGWGYLDNPDVAGNQPGTARYPIDYINWLWKDNTDPGPSRRTKAGSKREITASGLSGPITVPYGRCRVGGGLIAWGGVGSFYYHSYEVAQGPIHGFAGVFISEKDAYPPTSSYGSNALFETEVGLPNPTGPVPSFFDVVTNGEGVERYPYLATAHCRYQLNSILKDTPWPVFLIDGRTLRDPRLGIADDIPSEPEAFSKNPALALADYYTNTIYGIGVRDLGINWESVAEVAEYCDVSIAGLPRHTINWAIAAKTAHRDVTDTIRQLGRIKVFKRDGKKVFVAEKSASRVFTFTPQNSRPVQVEAGVPPTAPNILKVTFTNPAKQYGDDTVTVSTPAAESHAEPPSPVDFHFEALDNASESTRQGVWLLADSRNPLRVIWDGTTADAKRIEVMDRVGYYSPTALLGTSAEDPQDLRVVKVQRMADGVTVRFTGKLYDESYFSDATRVTEEPPINTTPPPTDPPDPPTSPALNSTIVLGDGMTQSLPRSVLVEWVPPATAIYDLRYKVTKQSSEDGAPEIVVYPSLTDGDVPVLVDLDLQHVWVVRIYAVIVATGATSVALEGVVEPAVDFNLPPAECPSWVRLKFDVTNKIYLYFGKAKIRTATLYGAGSLSQTGLTSADLSKVNDGNIAATAGTVHNNTTVTFNVGSAKSVREIRLYYGDTFPEGDTQISDSSVSFGLDNVEVSADGISFSPVVDVDNGRANEARAWNDTVTRQYRFLDEAYGPFQHWRCTFKSPFDTWPLKEIQLAEYVGDDPYFEACDIYDLSTGEERLFQSVPAGYDAEAVPIAVESLVFQNPGGVEFFSIHLRLYGRNVFGNRTEPIDICRTWDFTTEQYRTQLQTLRGSESVANKLFEDSNAGVTQAASDDSTKIATTEFVHDAIALDVPELAQDAVGSIATDTATIDVTYTDGAAAMTWDVKDDSITFAKMANLATDRLIGRDTAGTADPEALTVSGGVEFTGSGGIQRSALTGDVTASAGSNATTIANDAVTFAKMANLATDTLVGRDTAGTGDPEAISVGGGLEFSGSGGIRRSALTGDVTASAGSNATTVANDAVTFAKMQNIATDRLVGRDTAATGDPEEISVGGGLEFTGSGGIQRSALTGDVTASAGSGATTIPNNTVTYAKMQDVSATDKILGRSTAGAGDVEEITCTPAARTVLDDTTVAAMLATLGGAPLASPALTGTPTAPTAASSTNNTQLATTAFAEPRALRGSVSWNPTSIAGGASQSTNVTVTGAAIGDGAVGSLSVALQAGVTVSAEVSAANTVTVTVFNDGSGGASDPGGASPVTVRAWVFKQ
jgi:uncharacterized protein DUF5907